MWFVLTNILKESRKETVLEIVSFKLVKYWKHTPLGPSYMKKIYLLDNIY